MNSAANDRLTGRSTMSTSLAPAGAVAAAEDEADPAAVKSGRDRDGIEQKVDAPTETAAAPPAPEVPT